MKVNKLSIVIFILVFQVAITSCSAKVLSPGNTIKTPEYTQSDSAKLMTEYNELMNKKSAPNEIMGFIKTNIGNLNTEDADTVVSGLISIQKEQLENYKQKLFSQEISSVASKYKYEDLVSLTNITDENVKTLMEHAFKDGYKLLSAEGMYDFELNYENIKNAFSQYTSEQMGAFLSIMADETKQHFAEDGAITISLEQLADRVVNTENFVTKYSNSQYFKEIKQYNNWYLTAYLIGLNNTPAFSYEDNILRPDVLTNFENTRVKYKDTKLAQILNEYLEILKESELKKQRMFSVMSPR